MLVKLRKNFVQRICPVEKFVSKFPLIAEWKHTEKYRYRIKEKEKNMASLILHLEYIKLALRVFVCVCVKRCFRYDDDKFCCFVLHVEILSHFFFLCRKM